MWDYASISPSNCMYLFCNCSSYSGVGCQPSRMPPYMVKFNFLLNTFPLLETNIPC